MGGQLDCSAFRNWGSCCKVILEAPHAGPSGGWFGLGHHFGLEFDLVWLLRLKISPFRLGYYANNGMFEQERLIGRIQRRVIDDPDIYACFLSGSFGRRANDPYSDLDVALVYPDDQALERAWRDRTQFAQSVMPYVSLKSFDAVHIRPYFHIVLYANGSKVDYRFESQESVTPNPWDSHIKILKDTDGWAEAHQLSCGRQAIPQAKMSNHELTLLDQRFWVMYWDILRLLARGDTDKPFPIYLELLHFTFPPLLQVLPRDSAARLNLIEARFNADATLTSSHLHELLNAYIAARAAVVERHHLRFTSDQSFESQIQRLVERLT
jgi:hypothetical protein